MRRTNRILSGLILFGIILTGQAQDSIRGPVYMPGWNTITGKLIDKNTGAPAPHCFIRLHRITPTFITTDYRPLPPNLLKPFPNPYLPSTYSSSQGEFSFTYLRSWRPEYEIKIEIDDPKYQQEVIRRSTSTGTNDWGTIEVSERPFYFKNSYSSENKVTTTVVNTTGKRAYMRFWLTGEITRIDDSTYLGCTSDIRLQLHRKKHGHKKYATYRLAPGSNDITLRIKNYGPDRLISNIRINGGRSSREPSMVSTRVLQTILWPQPWPQRPSPILPPPTIIHPPILFPTNIIITPQPIPWPPTLTPTPTPWPPYTTHGSVSTRLVSPIPPSPTISLPPGIRP